MIGQLEHRGVLEIMDDATLEVSIVNDLRELARIAAKIDEFCTARDLGPQIGYAVNLSVDEILTNTISYGYDDEEPHKIEIVVSMEADTIVVVIVDDSTAFDLSQTPDADVESSVEERALGGLGLFLVHQMMDGVEYRRMGGCNVVTLTKKTAAAAAGDGPEGA